MGGIAVGAGSGDAERAGASPSASGSGGAATATDAKACGGSVGREAHATRASAGKRWSFMGDVGRWRRFVTEKAPRGTRPEFDPDAYRARRASNGEHRRPISTGPAILQGAGPDVTRAHELCPRP